MPFGVREIDLGRLCFRLDEASSPGRVLCRADERAADEFYAPAQIVRDARDHGVEVRRPCVDDSRWDCTLEPTGGRFLAVHLGLHQIRSLSNADGAAIIGARSTTTFTSVEEPWRRSGVQRAPIEGLADAGAFHAFGADRRQRLWKIRGLGEAPLPLFAAAD